jgi:hypothetical protein
MLYSLDSMQKCKDIVDKCSKSFIDLGADNGPNFDNDDMNIKERAYKNIITNKGVFDHNEDKINSNKNEAFEHLGQPETRINKYESVMLNKINSVIKQITTDIPERYVISELIIGFDRA